MNNLFLFAMLLGVGVIASNCARRRGRNPRAWFFLGFLFGLLGLAFLFLLPSRLAKKPVPVRPQRPSVSPFIKKALIESIDPQGVDKLWYYLDENHKQLGPMSIIALSQAWESGKVGIKTYVWNEQLTNWEPFERVLRPVHTPA